MQNITISEIFKKATEIFKIIFPKLAVFYLIAAAVPSALVNTYYKQNGPVLLLVMLLTFFVFAVMVFYAKAAYEGQEPSMPAAITGVKEGLLPCLSSLLVFTGLMIAAVIAFVILVLAASMIAAIFGAEAAKAAVSIIMFLALVPFIYLMLRVCFFFQIALAEKAYWLESIKKSWLITKGHLWKIVLTYLIVLPAGLVGILGQNAQNQLVYFIILTLLAPLTFYATTAFLAMYFMLRERHSTLTHL